MHKKYKKQFFECRHRNCAVAGVLDVCLSMALQSSHTPGQEKASWLPSLRRHDEMTMKQQARAAGMRPKPVHIQSVCKHTQRYRCCVFTSTSLCNPCTWLLCNHTPRFSVPVPRGANTGGYVNLAHWHHRTPTPMSRTAIHRCFAGYSACTNLC